MKRLFTIALLSVLFIFNVRAGDTIRLHLNSNPLYGGIVQRNLTTAQSGNTLQAKIGDVFWIMSSDPDTISVIFDANPVGATAWNIDVPPYGGTGGGYVVTFSVVGTYTYHVQMKDVNGQDSVMKSGLSIIVSTTGINDNHFSSVASTVFPNPFIDNITITHTKADAIQIYNILGKAIGTYNLKSSAVKTELNLSEIPSGIYFYKILSEGVVIDTKKIIKE